MKAMLAFAFKLEEQVFVGLGWNKVGIRLE